VDTDRGDKLTMDELAEAAATSRDDVAELAGLGLLRADEAGRFRRSDIQRIRAVVAMRSTGIEFSELLPAFDAEAVSIQPMDVLYPEPAAATSQTFEELATSLGLSPTELSTLMIAAGLPAPRPAERVREDDADLVRRVLDTGRQLGGGEIVARTARIFGEAARRAAEGSLGLFDEGVNQRLARDVGEIRDPELVQQVNETAGRLMTQAEELLAALFRRHLEHAILGSWAENAEMILDKLGVRHAPERQPAIAFVDLSGYTHLTEREGDTTALSVSSSLADLAQASAARRAGRVVKLLGDGAMLHFREPAQAVRGALDLVGAIAASELPPAHAGVHAGPLIERDGDYFGRTVNLAARIGGQARPGEVLVSSAVATVDAADLHFEPGAEVELKGIGPVALHRAAWR
jgi:adenylate cyclase